MRRWLRSLPLRVRLIVGYVVAMTIVLTAAASFVYWRVEYALDRGLDAELRQATAAIRPLVTPAGSVSSLEQADATGAGWQVVDADGRVLAHGGPVRSQPALSRPALDRAGDRAVTVDVGSLLPISERPLRVRVTALPARRHLLVTVRRDHRDEALRELVAQLALAAVGALLVASLVGDVLARAALRPVERYRRQAAAIADGDPELRLDVAEVRHDEVTRLGHTLNDMLASLDQALTRERRFVNDASHELRTPLTLLTSRIQLARRRPRTVADHERILDELAVDAGRLVQLADQLLALGRPPAAGRTARPDETADLAEVARAVVVPAGLEVTAPHGPVVVAAGPVALERIITNLVTNALRHGAAPVSVTVGASDGWGVLVVGDAGPGMSRDLLRRATERFVRADEARARPGSGLGLSLVTELVTEYGGELRLCHDGEHVSHGVTAPVRCTHGGGMYATVLLPRVAPAPPTSEPGDEAPN